jgi:hypothetical protein
MPTDTPSQAELKEPVDPLERIRHAQVRMYARYADLSQAWADLAQAQNEFNDALTDYNRAVDDLTLPAQEGP